MNSLKFASAAVLAALSVAAFSSPSDIQKIRTVYSKLAHAMLTRNEARIEALEGPGFTDSENGKTMDAKEANAMMKEQFGIGRFTEFRVHLTSIKIIGKNATVESSYSMRAVAKMSGKTHHISATGKTRDRLEKTARGWLFTATKDTESIQMMDGKPVHPGM